MGLPQLNNYMYLHPLEFSVSSEYSMYVSSTHIHVQGQNELRVVETPKVPLSDTQMSTSCTLDMLAKLKQEVTIYSPR